MLTTLGAESPVGDEKIVAIFLMTGGILTGMYATSAMVSFIVGGDLKRYLLKRKMARIEEAKGLASCLPGDADNVYVTLTVRGFSSDINITARAEDSKTHTKLIRAGADRVVCPPVLIFW